MGKNKKTLKKKGQRLTQRSSIWRWNFRHQRDKWWCFRSGSRDLARNRCHSTWTYGRPTQCVWEFCRHGCPAPSLLEAEIGLRVCPPFSSPFDRVIHGTYSRSTPMWFSLLLPTITPVQLLENSLQNVRQPCYSADYILPRLPDQGRETLSLWSPFAYFQPWLLPPPFPQIQPSRSCSLGSSEPPLSTKQIPTFSSIPCSHPPPLWSLPWLPPGAALFLFLLCPCDPLCTHLCLFLSAGLSSPPEHELFQRRYWALFLSVPWCQAQSLAWPRYPVEGSYKAVDHNEHRLWVQSQAGLLTVTWHLYASSCNFPSCKKRGKWYFLSHKFLLTFIRGDIYKGFVACYV